MTVPEQVKRHRQAIAWRNAGLPVSMIAKFAEVHRQTVYNWLERAEHYAAAAG
jgi:transposase